MRLENHTEHGVNQFSTQNLPGLNFSNTRKFEHSVLRLAPLLHQNWLQERLPVLCWLCKPEYLPLPQEQRLTILGTPVGSEAYIQHQLQNTRQSHQHLLQRIPDIDDLQASWLLLLFCASPRCNHILRTTAPALAADFAADHDVAVAGCLQQLLGGPDLSATALATAHVPLAQGGSGLQSATATTAAAYWASWADTLPTLARQLPAFTARVQDFFSNPAQAPPSIQAAHQAAGTLSANGWNPPTWHDLTNGTSPPRPADLPNEGPTARGWQHKAANVIQTRYRAQLLTALDLEPADAVAL